MAEAAGSGGQYDSSADDGADGGRPARPSDDLTVCSASSPWTPPRTLGGRGLLSTGVGHVARSIDELPARRAAGDATTHPPSSLTSPTAWQGSWCDEDGFENGFDGAAATATQRQQRSARARDAENARASDKSGLAVREGAYMSAASPPQLSESERRVAANDDAPAAKGAPDNGLRATVAAMVDVIPDRSAASAAPKRACLAIRSVSWEDKAQGGTIVSSDGGAAAAPAAAASSSTARRKDEEKDRRADDDSSDRDGRDGAYDEEEAGKRSGQGEGRRRVALFQRNVSARGVRNTLHATSFIGRLSFGAQNRMMSESAKASARLRQHQREARCDRKQ